ncbi:MULTISPECIES: lipoate--protein ligase family protein [Kocuria]|uniref:lipoate--protein ligase family protein n=1 Tax=Kocuria TaxID=57493 RepID=UPI0011A0722D|nr:MULTISPECIES: lipoate--protein ligase family protein [Kocuria]QIR69883.1 lipoate--protein ligase family protein [Kocuria sp. KD4]
MKLIRQRESLGAEQDYRRALSILDAARGGATEPVLRVYQPRPTVAFGRRDELNPGFPRARQAALDAAFTPLVRRVGGRAAAYHGGCLVIDHVEPDPDPKTGIQDRYRLFGDMVVAALEELEIPAQVGEIPGEYCAGEYSVHAPGTAADPNQPVKLAGTAQRVVAGAWYFSTVLVIEVAEPLRSVLEDVYSCLGVSWEPATAGCVADVRPGTTVTEVEAALMSVYDRYSSYMGYGPVSGSR